MPLLLPVSELQCGMRLAKSIVRDFQVLLAQDHELSEKDIIFLMHNCPKISVYVCEPNLEEAVDFAQDPIEPEVDEQVMQQRRQKLKSIAKKATSLLRNNISLDPQKISELEETISQLLQHIQENPITMNILEQQDSWHAYLQSHGMDVFNFGLLLAYGIQDHMRAKQKTESTAISARNLNCLTPLSIAALFHDLGMVPIQHLYDKTEPLTEEDMAAIKVHPLVSVELLPDEINPAALKAILHHHENFDGSGYPEGLKGKEINILGRILRIADAYTAAITNRTYQKAKPPITVLWEMMYEDYARCYDAALLQLFADIIKPLPIGAKLKLNTGQWGVVVQHQPSNPFHPQLVIAFDQQNKLIPKSQLEKPFYLDQREDIQVKSFGNHDISIINQPLPDATSLEYDDLFQQIASEIFDLVRV